MVCGIDEVGRGAWAGPVTVAAVIPAREHVRGVRDSKELTRPEREKAARSVRKWAVAIGIGHASYEECDELGMTAALRAAGLRALAQLDAQGYVPDRIVLDGNHDYLRMPSKVTTVIKGDAKCLAVAAASCVAKVTRDHMMIDESEHYPPYDFESNVGYPAPAHKLALAGYGPERDPPSLVDLHGLAVLARGPACTGSTLPLASGTEGSGNEGSERWSTFLRCMLVRSSTRADPSPAWATTSGGAPPTVKAGRCGSS